MNSLKRKTDKEARRQGSKDKLIKVFINFNFKYFEGIKTPYLVLIVATNVKTFKCVECSKVNSAVVQSI